jgi:hypothetical protein
VSKSYLRTNGRCMQNGTLMIFYYVEIEINRVIRQGNPLVPLLFAVSMHPFIEYMDNQITNSSLKIVKTKGNL